MPAAARAGDNHRCRRVDPAPHRGGEILTGCRTVLIGGQRAARVGDMAHCEGEAYDPILTGCRTVEIGGRPAARLGDATDGGHVATGCTTVQIGAHWQVAALRRAARTGAALCEKLPRAPRPRGR